ncbi:ABC transporter ATP-binding protein [bacterium]|nr:ABC transporter ATP-binding protein [bacterium]MBU4602720.1 ABC transporter ATP-binding protein [bacterium]
MSRVKLENVWKIYKTRKKDVIGVKKLNLDIKNGQFVALLGPSGCGKSSTLRMLAGLEEITKGKIWVGERIVNDIIPQDRNIAMVFENYALYTHKTVFENIAFPLVLRGVSPDEIKKQVYWVAEILKIVDILNENTNKLSGGQRQRVSIGRALVRNPEVLLMDEPISHLEAKLRTHMRAELTRLQRKFNRTTVYVTHDQHEAITMADQIAVMNFGELQQYDTPINLFNRPFNEFVAGFIGEPPMNMFDCNLEKELNDLYLVSKNFKFKIPDKIKIEIKKEQILSKEMKLGIRPQDMVIRRQKKNYRNISGEMFHWEVRGDEGIALVKIDKNMIAVKTPANFKFSKKEEIQIDFDLEKINIFNKSTTKNICVSDKEFISLAEGGGSQ